MSKVVFKAKVQLLHHLRALWQQLIAFLALHHFIARCKHLHAKCGKWDNSSNWRGKWSRERGLLSLQLAATWRVVSGLVNALSCCFSAPLQSLSSSLSWLLSLLPCCHHASSVVGIPFPQPPSPRSHLLLLLLFLINVFSLPSASSLFSICHFPLLFFSVWKTLHIIIKWLREFFVCLGLCNRNGNTLTVSVNVCVVLCLCVVAAVVALISRPRASVHLRLLLLLMLLLMFFRVPHVVLVAFVAIVVVACQRSA